MIARQAPMSEKQARNAAASELEFALLAHRSLAYNDHVNNDALMRGSDVDLIAYLPDFDIPAATSRHTEIVRNVIC